MRNARLPHARFAPLPPHARPWTRVGSRKWARGKLIIAFCALPAAAQVKFISSRFGAVRQAQIGEEVCDEDLRPV